MKTCTLCGELYAPQIDTQTICSTCRKNYSKGSLVSLQRDKAEGRRDMDNAPLKTPTEWVGAQRTLAKKLGLNHVGEYLGKTCRKCGHPLKKGSKTDLCPAHYKAYRREYNKLAKQKERASQQ